MTHGYWASNSSSSSGVLPGAGKVVVSPMILTLVGSNQIRISDDLRFPILDLLTSRNYSSTVESSTGDFTTSSFCHKLRSKGMVQLTPEHLLFVVGHGHVISKLTPIKSSEYEKWQIGNMNLEHLKVSTPARDLPSI
jgi:hypothetical protein